MVEIRLRDSRSKRVVPLEPTAHPGRVAMYVCGPTVYDRAHLGNARPVIVFDVLYRLLRHVYGEGNVTYARNFTDVDDRINATALARKEAGAPGTLEDLIAKDHAYEKAGHVLFRVRSYADYGKLSGRSVDDMIAGARVEVAPFKEDPMDFVLWKPSTDDLPGWDSPWGRGRPGWHIECSAMAHALLGESFDIHGGGNDLMFPHHENEIAQSCCAHPEGQFARIWMHNEMLQVEGKKMSKSLGNFFTVRDLLDQGIPGEVIRFVFLSTHYSKPMDWTARKAEEAEKVLRKWYGQIAAAPLSDAAAPAVMAALADDLNTAQAIAELHQIAKSGDLGALRSGFRLLGLLTDGVPDWARRVEADLSPYAARLADAREKAVQTTNFAPVDALKSALTAAGVEVRMSKDGVELIPGPGFDPAKLEGLL